MIRVGITGGIGSGKSTVCRIFAMLGVALYDSDRQARRLMNEDGELAIQIRRLLGEESYCNGLLNRSYVSQRVFAQSDLLSGLNSIVHPAVGKDFVRWTTEQEHAGAAYVVLESAILFESDFDRLVDKCITISAPIELRIARVVARDGVDQGAVRGRIAAQWSDEQRASVADYEIVNDEQHMITEQVLRFDKLFRDESRSCGG